MWRLPCDLQYSRKEEFFLTALACDGCRRQTSGAKGIDWMPEIKSEARPSRAPKLQLVSCDKEGPFQLSSGAPQDRHMAAQVTFERAELNLLLNLYGKKVAAGEWRDYALDFLPSKAIFSVFRRASEIPIYRVEKIPELVRRQGLYAVMNAGGQILRRGHQLDRVLRVLETKFKVIGME